ncbi:hypothetical protein N9J72_01515 [Candidatus Gracilibacteria bacterium]|nr:hypothetical protein [Candidatus Gracilibacteria bacterium]
MPENPDAIIEQIENATEQKIESIITREEKSFHLFRKYVHKPELGELKKKIHEIVEAYPPVMRPFVMTWIIVAYISIIPLAGTTSLLLWGSIGKYLNSRKK